MIQSVVKATLRFGALEYSFHSQQLDKLPALLTTALNTHFTALADSPGPLCLDAEQNCSRYGKK